MGGTVSDQSYPNCNAFYVILYSICCTLFRIPLFLTECLCILSEKDLVIQYNKFCKQVAENKSKSCQTRSEKEEELSKLQCELAEAKTRAEQLERDIEQCMRNAVGDKENEISTLLAEQHKIHEQ